MREGCLIDGGIHPQQGQASAEPIAARFFTLQAKTSTLEVVLPLCSGPQVFIRYGGMFPPGRGLGHLAFSPLAGWCLALHASWPFSCKASQAVPCGDVSGHGAQRLTASQRPAGIQTKPFCRVLQCRVWDEEKIQAHRHESQLASGSLYLRSKPGPTGASRRVLTGRILHTSSIRASLHLCSLVPT